MPNFEPLQNSIPIAPLKLASLEGCRDFANLVDKHLSDFRHENPSHTKKIPSLTEAIWRIPT